MLKRLYIHNYKCLVNFEINFDKNISLFLGANGAGKTTVLSALYEIQKFIIERHSLDDKRRLANDSGCWFSRENNLTRMQKITPEDESGLSISELVERGWIYEP